MLILSHSIDLVDLVGGATSNEGRVEILVNGIRLTMRDYGTWTDADAKVLCRAAGYE